MIQRNTFKLSIITALAFSFLSSPVLAQQKLKEQLVGTWTYVASVAKRNDGAKVDRWGTNAKGLAIFGADGRYSFMISRSDIPKFAVNNVTQGTAQENKAVMNGVIAHFGTWSVDEATKTLNTTIEAASFPNLNGVSQKRVISTLTADELKYTNSATATGSIDEVSWKRAK